MFFFLYNIKNIVYCTENTIYTCNCVGVEKERYQRSVGSGVEETVEVADVVS